MDKALSLTAQIVSAYLSNNEASASQLPTLIRDVHRALSTVDQPVAEPPETMPVVPAQESVFPDHIVCLDCGKSFTSLRRHIFADHGMTPKEYRAKWGLLPSYPMVPPEYAARRSQLAKDGGLGRRRRFNPVPKSVDALRT